MKDHTIERHQSDNRCIIPDVPNTMEVLEKNNPQMKIMGELFKAMMG